MKWSIVGLIAAGLVAAVSAAVLVLSLKSGSRTKTAGAAPEVEIAMAAKTLAKYTIVKNTDVIGKTMPRGQAPKDWLSPVRVIGRILAVKMIKDQPFTKQSLVVGGIPGLRLAAALGPGKRAVSVSLPASSGLRGLLYPGSVVDVLASLRMPSESSGQAEVISVTLLQGIQVLGVEDRTVVSAEDGDSSPQRSNRGQFMVTLELDSKQAELLQLARQYGTISLALRNPTDEAPVAMAPTVLRELSRSLARLQKLSVVQAGTPEHRTGTDATRLPAAMPINQWETIVIRGGSVERCVFPVPK